MKKRFINFVFPLFALLMISNGCTDEFVTKKPLGQTSTETFYTTMEAADMAVTVCYSGYAMSSFWDLRIMMMLGSIASDEAEAGAGGKADIPAYQRLDQLRHLASDNELFEHTWGFLYRTIGYCNVALENLPKITEETDPNFNATIIKRRLAEARFIRAHNYLQLLMMYGGVPLVDHVLTPDEYNSPRAEMSAIFDLIKGDLEIAIADLPTRTQWGANEVGRVSKGAAMALMSKTYLFESSYAKYHAGDERFNGLVEDWAEAAYWAEEVINSGEYRLEGIDGERYDTWRGPNTGGFAWIFMMAGENSGESVFEIQNAQDTKGWWNTRGNGLSRWCAPRRIKMNNSDDVSDLGWGWWSPGDPFVNAFDDGDPRLKATVIDRGDSVQCNFAGDGGVAFRAVDWNELFDGTGVHRNSRKYEASYEEYWQGSQTWGDGPINVKLIRYADVVLWAAEANLELGNSSKALTYINMVRKRARASGDTGVPADLTSVTHKDIEDERLMELGMEGHRMFDVIRWNKGSEYLNHTLSDGDQIEYIPGKHDFYPIPTSEVNLTGGALVQYEGWE